ncbi:metallophosphoesterase [Paenibacillus sp. GD4]|uniref:metallophosphoesterase family protein n=1 Tax=Paenibacillus sp. GD4 TaxID=3068890 RepID=UPI002796873D|nr:metallophosphoesterase [Paenibacillus sp. GD4]MDQ1911023.1 metallophosphoesterase [Paenibacillus sp. GD4]
MKRSLVPALSFFLLLTALLTAPPTVMAESLRKPRLTFAVISDIHVQSWDKESVRRFRQALEDLHKAAPGSSALIVNGDTGNGFPEDYSTVQRTIAAHLHWPHVFYTIGNHEFYKAWHRGKQWSEASFPNGETEEASVGRFLQLTGEPRVYYDRWLQGYHFIFLGSERYRQSDPGNGEDAWLSDEQLGWLRSKLQDDAQKEPQRPVFLFLHQPLQGTVSGSSERGVVQLEELRSILRKHPQVLLFSGHTHFELDKPDMVIRGDSVTTVNSSSVRAPFKAAREPFADSEDESEGIVVQVDPDEVSIRGRSFKRHSWITGADSMVPLQNKTGP